MRYSSRALAFTREGDVNVFLGVKPPEQDVTGDTSYYKSEYSSKEEMQEALKEHVENVEIEGSVLLKNDDNALPLNSGASVTLFGHAAAHNVFHGGSGGPSNSGVDLYTAMKDEGFKINDKVYDVLKNDAQNYGKKGDIAEVPVSAYNSVKSSFDNEYNDAAIVVLRRYGGEEGELNHGLDGIWGRRRSRGSRTRASSGRKRSP